MLMKSSILRLFFGIPITEDKAREFQNRITEQNPKISQKGRWVRPGNHHITLRFLGSVASQKIPLITDAVSKAIAGETTFTVRLRSITRFPNPEGRLITVNIEPSRALQAVYDALDLALTPGNFPAENRAFQPHITLLRGINPKDNMQFKTLSLEDELFDVKELCLYQNIPVDNKSQYIILHRFPLL